MCVTWQWKWLLFSSLTVQGVWQVFILLESPFWGLQRSMPSIVLQTKFLFNNTEKSGYDVGIYSVRFWISDSYGDSHLDPNMTLQFCDGGIFLCFCKIQSNLTKMTIHKEIFSAPQHCQKVFQSTLIL
jgi:hypothetical protein